MKKKKVLFISSTGGHLHELLQLSQLFEKYDYHIVTEKDKTNEFLKEKYENRVSYLPYGTRSHLIKYIFSLSLILCDVNSTFLNVSYNINESYII